MVNIGAPDRGDVVWIDCDPSAGNEQRKRRPCLVLSPRSYNEPAGLMVACPITSKIKGYPFEVPLPLGGSVDGVVLADQVRSWDWRARRAAHIGMIDTRSLQRTCDLIATLLSIQEPA